MTDKTTSTLEVPHAVLTYDVREPQTPSDEPPLLLVGLPMGAEGFTTLAGHFPDRTVVTYDPRGSERSTRDLGTEPELPGIATHADDVHRVIGAAGGGPVDLFASSGGATVALDLVARYAGDVRILVAHEPPVASVLPDREAMAAAMMNMHRVYLDRGFGAAMAAFITLASVQGEITDAYLSEPDPDPAAFGLPSEDDGSRDDLMFGVNMLLVPRHQVDPAAARGAERVVLAVGEDTGEEMTGRATRGVGALLGIEPVEFPGGHGGFIGGEYGQPADKPTEFAARLREVLAG